MHFVNGNTSGIGNNSAFEDTQRDGHGFRTASTSYYIVVSAMCVFGTVANGLFLLSFIKVRQLRTMSNGLLWHLSLMDLLNCCVAIPWYLVVTTGIASIQSCYLWKVSFTLLPGMSMQSQCLISVNRYCLVTKSVTVYKKWFNRQTAAAYLATGWALHVVVVVCVFMVTKMTDVKETQGCNNFTEFTGPRKLNYYILGSSALIYLLVASAFYHRLVAFVRRNAMTLDVSRRADSKVSLTLFILLIFSVFTLMVSPIVLLLNGIFRTPPFRLNALDEIGTSILFLNYCISPIVYAFHLRPFAHYLKTLFRLSTNNRVDQDQRLSITPNVNRDRVQTTGQWTG